MAADREERNIRIAEALLDYHDWIGRRTVTTGAAAWHSRIALEASLEKKGLRIIAKGKRAGE